MNNETLNESTFANFRRDLQTLNYAELNYLISDIMLEIKKRSYNEGMVKAMTIGISAEVIPQKSDQQVRDEIIEKAKRDLIELANIEGEYTVDSSTSGRKFCEADFIVNKEKRTIVVLLRGVITNKIWSKGIAKCDPSDCFNAHIGKAIALRRALGLEVPSEYYNAPQPTEVRIGDVVAGGRNEGFYTKDKRFTLTEINEVDGGYRYDEDPVDWIEECQIGKIVDDSREGDANGEG